MEEEKILAGDRMLVFDESKVKEIGKISLTLASEPELYEIFERAIVQGMGFMLGASMLLGLTVMLIKFMHS